MLRDKSTIILAIAIVVLAVVVVMNNPVINVTGTGGVADKDTISVSGNAELTVSPDKAEININILTEAPTADEAQERNAERSNSVIEALKDAGVKDSEIETTNYYLSKRREWNRDTNKYEDVGYQLSHTIKVTTKDIDEVGSLADTAVDAGANQIQGINFGLTDETEKEVRDQALEEAAELAKEKADSLASALDVKIVKIVSVQESNYYYTPFRYGDYAMAEESMAGAKTQISPEDVEVRSTVNVVFEISS